MSSNTYSIPRLRLFLNERDNARVALDAAADRVKPAREALQVADRMLADFEAARPEIRNDADFKHYERIRVAHVDAVKQARELLDAREHERQVASERLHVAASLAGSAFTFARQKNFLPTDLAGWM